MILEFGVFLAASFLAAAAATIAGFGSSTLLIPVATLFLDLRTSIFIVAVFHLFNNLFKIRAFWKSIDFTAFRQFGIPSVLLSFTGAALSSVLPISIIKSVLGAFLILYALISLLKPEMHFPKTRFSAVLGGGLSGLLAGLIGLGGAIRAAFLIGYQFAKQVYIATSAIIAGVIDITRIPTYIFTDAVTDPVVYTWMPFLVVSAYLGVKTGKYFLGRISQDLFRKIVFGALILMGLKLLS